MRAAAILGALLAAGACGPLPIDVLLRLDPPEWTDVPDGGLCAPSAEFTGDVLASAPGAVTESTCRIKGNVTIDADVEGDANPLAGVREIDGDLTIEAGRSGGAVAALERVSGHLHVKGVTARPDVPGAGSLAKLTEVGRLTVENTSADGLAGLTALTRVTTNVLLLRVTGAGELTSLGALSQVGGDLALRSLPGLTGLSGLRALTKANLSLLAVPDLVTLALPPLLTDASAFSVADSPVIERIDGANLASLQRLSLQRNGALRTVSFPALKEVGSALDVLDNPALETLLLPVVEALPSTTFCRNAPGLADDVEAINARLGREVVRTCPL